MQSIPKLHFITLFSASEEEAHFVLEHGPVGELETSLLGYLCFPLGFLSYQTEGKVVRLLVKRYYL